MKLLINENNVVFDFGEDIIFAKPGAEDGGLMLCGEDEATHIWNREKNSACMAHREITMLEVTEIPEWVEADKYKYVDGEFVENEDYIERHSDTERISALEDMMNLMLMGGI